jgi:hypothetical protein
MSRRPNPVDPASRPISPIRASAGSDRPSSETGTPDSKPTTVSTGSVAVIAVSP